jgi:hypothetical protein
MKKIKVAFSDFWSGFDYNPAGKKGYDNTFYRLLSERYDIEIDNESPDFLIFSVFGNSHTNFRNCKKIFYTGENRRPDFSICDYAITFDYLDHPNHHRFPLSALILSEKGIKEFPKNFDLDSIKKKKTKFCNFVFSNSNAQKRNYLFQELSKYKKIDAGGIVFNNIGHTVGDKLEFLDQYKFTIAFENSEHEGYTTEKIVHPKLVDSIPIYWGNPLVSLDWNSKAFINYYDHKDIKSMIDFVKEVDNNEALYDEMLLQPHYNELNIPKDHDLQGLLSFLDRILTGEMQYKLLQ